MERDLYEDRAVDNVWDGWDAALILSKRKSQTILGKRKFMEISSTDGGDIIMATVSQPDQTMEEDNESVKFRSAMYSPEVDGGKRKKYMIAKAVTTLSLYAMDSVWISWKEELLSLRSEDFKYKTVRGSVLSSVAKFVLSIFSVEELERICYLSEISNQYLAFCSNLDQSECDPLVAVAERRVEVDKFSKLREHDVCDVIRQYEHRTKYTFFEPPSPWAFQLFPNPIEFEDVSESDVSIAMMELDKYVPLQSFSSTYKNVLHTKYLNDDFGLPLSHILEHREMQLTLEMARRKSFLITKTLLLEALMGIKISDSDFCLTSPDESAPDEPKKVAFVRKRLMNAIVYGFNGLLQLKQMACDYFQEALSFPLLHGSLRRPCTDELIEVIKIADYERGMQRQHFISVQHILLGLSLSRVGDIVRRGIFDNVELPSDLPMLGIYKLSSDAANIIGDEHVGLEHFVITILYGKLEKDGKALEEHKSLGLDYKAWDMQLLDSLRNATKCAVESFEDEDIAEEIIPRDECIGNTVMCGGVLLFERLEKAVTQGIKLPSIRQEKFEKNSSQKRIGMESL